MFCLAVCSVAVDDDVAVCRRGKFMEKLPAKFDSDLETFIFVFVLLFDSSLYFGRMEDGSFGKVVKELLCANIFFLAGVTNFLFDEGCDGVPPAFLFVVDDVIGGCVLVS